MSNIVELKYPIEINGVECSCLSIRRPTIGDIILSNKEKDSQLAEVNLLADLCGASPNDIKKIDFADYLEMLKVVGKMQTPE